MSGEFSVLTLIGYALALVAWIATIVLALAALLVCKRRKAESIGRAVVMSVVALVIAILGTTVFRVWYERRISFTRTIDGVRPVVESSSWHVDSRWFFAAAGVLCIFALVKSIRARSEILAA